jgi:hypothetical protein
MATTGVGASAAAKAVTLATGSTSAEVVTGSTALLSVGVRPNSCRAAAIIIHGNGDSTGGVGELPANGFRTALTALDIAVVTAATGACGGVDTTGFGVSSLTSACATDGLAVGGGAAATCGSSVVCVDSVASDGTVRAVALPVFGFDSTASLVGLLDCCEALDFFCLFGFGSGSAAAGFVSLESVDALVFSAACLPSDAAEPEVDDSLDVDDD